MKNYFTEKELSCKCCGELVFDRDFKHKLNAAREEAGVPFRITSGYRCDEYNRQINGSETSSHLKGLAVDIDVTRPRARYVILVALIRVGFNRIGIGSDFIHVDDDTSKPRELVWVY